MIVSPADFLRGSLQVPDAVSFNAGDPDNELLMDVIDRHVPEILLYALGEDAFVEFKTIEQELVKYHNEKAKPDPYQFPVEDYGRSLEDWYQLFYGTGNFREAILHRVYCFYIYEDDKKRGPVGVGRNVSDSFASDSPREEYVRSMNRYATIMNYYVATFLYKHPSFNALPCRDIRFAEVEPMFTNYWDLTL